MGRKFHTSNKHKTSHIQDLHEFLLSNNLYKGGDFKLLTAKLETEGSLQDRELLYPLMLFISSFRKAILRNTAKRCHFGIFSIMLRL